MIKQQGNNVIVTPSGHTLNTLIDYNKFRPTLISHEVPQSMLEMSRAFNDYDYALVHLFMGNPQYFNFYKESVKMGRRVILDNSLYELGEAFDMKEYAEWIERLKPTYYIIPDTFWDSQATINQAMEWMVKYGNDIDPKIRRIGVAQGSTYNEIKTTYKFLAAICDCIAFTFKFSPKMLEDPDLKLDEFLDTLVVRYPGIQISGPDLTVEDKQAACRYLVLKKLEEDGVIDYRKEHHLLGLQNTTLLYEACLFPWVTSIDTSNPVINGFEGNAYYFNETIMGYDTNKCFEHAFIGNSGHPKPETQLKDVFYKTPYDSDWQYVIDDILYNIRSFREVVNPSHLTAIFNGHRCMNEKYIAPHILAFMNENNKQE
jgi:hypothetical protein